MLFLYRIIHVEYSHTTTDDWSGLPLFVIVVDQYSMYSCVCVCQAVHQPVFVACHNCIVLQCLLMVRYFPSKRSQSKKPTETEHVRT